MTLGDVRNVMCSTPHDLPTLSTCLWQTLHLQPGSQTSKHDARNDHHFGNGCQDPKSRYRHSACLVGEHIYVFGGKEATSPRKDIWKYSLRQQKWEKVELQGGSLPLLQGHTSVAYKELILIFGGTFSDSLGDVQLWTFNTELSYLREVKIEPGTAQPTCRRDHSAVVHNDFMYIYGGFIGSRGANQELWAFNIDKEEWIEMTNLNQAHPGHRYSHSAVVADNAMWLFGGMAGLSPKSDLWRYSFLLHQWKKTKGVGSAPCLSGHTASVIHHQMIVVGGNSQGKLVNDVWCFSFDTSAWQKLSSAGVTLPRLSFHCCVSYSPPHPRHRDSMKHTHSSLLPKSATRHQHCAVKPRSRSVERSAGIMSLTKTSMDRERNGFLEETEQCVCKGDSDSPGRIDPDIDPQIHVSLKEPLIAVSPKMPNSSKPSVKLSWNRLGYSKLKEDLCFENPSACLNCSVPSLHSSLSAPEKLSAKMSSDECCSQKSVPDLIDLSDSPVLNASMLSLAADSWKHMPFRDDTCLEELEMVGLGGMGWTSYPSQNAFLSVAQASSMKPFGVSDVAFQSANHQWSQCADLHLLYQMQPCQSAGSDAELKQLNPDFTSAGTFYCCPAVHPSHCQRDTTVSTKTQQGLKLEDLAGQSSQDAHKTVWPQDKSVKSQQILEQEFYEFLLSHSTPPHDKGIFEAETSFIEHDDSLLPENQTAPETEAGGQTRPLAVSATAFDSHVMPSSWRTSHSRKARLKDNTATDGHERIIQEESEDTMRVREELELSEPCLLVVGGRTDEVGSVHPKPLAIWKGLFL